MTKKQKKEQRRKALLEAGKYAELGKSVFVTENGIIRY